MESTTAFWNRAVLDSSESATEPLRYAEPAGVDLWYVASSATPNPDRMSLRWWMNDFDHSQSPERLLPDFTCHIEFQPRDAAIT
jgi:hypothetical protein